MTMVSRAGRAGSTLNYVKSLKSNLMKGLYQKGCPDRPACPPKIEFGSSSAKSTATTITASEA